MTAPARARPNGQPTAVVAWRIIAFGIDCVLVLAVAVAAFAVAVEWYDVPDAPRACRLLEQTGADVASCIELDADTIMVIDSPWDVAILFTPVLVAIANWVLLQGATGSSVGKHCTGLRVVDSTGEDCGYGRALVRTLLLPLDAVLFLPVLIVMLISRRHRRIGDVVAGTYVVAKAERPIFAR